MLKIELQSKGHLEAHERYKESLTEQKSSLQAKIGDFDKIVADVEVAIDKYSSLSAPFLHLVADRSLQLRFDPTKLARNNDEYVFGANLEHGAKLTLVRMNADADADLNSIKASNESKLDELNKKSIALKQAQAKVVTIKSNIKSAEKSINVMQENVQMRRKEIGALEDETFQVLERTAAFEKDAISLEAKTHRVYDDHAMTMASKQRSIEVSAERMEAHLGYLSNVVNGVEAHKASAAKHVRAIFPHHFGS